MTEETRTELEATLAARKELGPEYEHHLVESFLDKVENGLERRRAPAPALPDPPRLARGHLGPPVVLGSIGLGIPVTAIALSNSPGTGGVVVAVVAWAAIAVANLAFWRR